MDIKWVGSPNFNVGRQGIKPIAIVNHVSQGTLASMGSWFNSTENKNSSSNFGVGLDGTIHQFVKIEDKAWCQGIPIPEGLNENVAPIIKDMKCNPNFYCVSIEREGYYVKNEDGTFTGELGWLDGSAIPIAQYNAILWLHRYIMDYCNSKLGSNMKLNEYSVIGHFQIDPKRKPLCPGINFPWAKLYAELKIAESMTLLEYEYRQELVAHRPDRLRDFVTATNRVVDLYNKAKDPNDKFTDLALEKGDKIVKYLKDNGLWSAT